MSRPATKYEHAGVVANALSNSKVVTRLESGFARVCTYGPGERVPGVKFTDDAVTVRICITWGTSVAEADAAVRSVLAEHIGARRLDVEIADMDEETSTAMEPT